ncbi:MAG: hypothetical protein IJS32_01305 [Kiritimatiellae bacterium]|nr:hypothetical protein [Kiritimatiellia bacterium]
MSREAVPLSPNGDCPRENVLPPPPDRLDSRLRIDRSLLGNVLGTGQPLVHVFHPSRFLGHIRFNLGRRLGVGLRGIRRRAPFPPRQTAFGCLVLGMARPRSRQQLSRHPPKDCRADGLAMANGARLAALRMGGGTLGMAAAFRSVRWRNGAARGWWILRRIFWPVVFIVPFSVWRLPSLDAARGTGLDFAKVPGNGKPAMVVLLFDMLGYEELFDGNGNILPAYTNFAAFCETADVFHAAESAGGATATSLPGFILQSRFAPEHRYSLEDWLFTDGTNWFRAEGFALQSLPALARAHGGRAQSIGMYIPWDSILPGVWNATESMAFAHGNQGVHVFGGTPSFWSAVREHASWYLVFDSKSPLGAVFKLAGIGERAEASGYDERVSLVFRARRLFREALSPGDFFFIHVDLPHYPYVVGRDGERLPLSLLHDEDAGLAAQTGGADWALGVWLETIASSPEGRNAWIVVTSDHNLNFGSHLDGRPLRHVPFLVHRPGQTQRRDVSEPADLTDLRHVLPDLPLFAGEGTE